MNIFFGNNLLSHPAFIKQIRRHSGPFALIADNQVASFYGKTFLTFMKNEGFKCHLVTFQGGEKSKTRKTKEAIEDALLAQKLGRDTLLILLGGGVTTDLGGFVAATYLRGIPYLSIPTSLLAMVDSSIGGKTGVNVKQAKNIIGAIYPPLATFIDFSFLSTLSDSEMRSGSAEILKAGLISDKRLFDELAENLDRWKERDPDFLKKLIIQSVKIKQKVIEKDLEEKGKRHILNFGHTIGHAVEVLEEYTLLHGEAVAIGMVAEALIAHKMESLTWSNFNALYQVVQNMGFSLKLSEKVTINKMKETIKRDKKAEKTAPRFVILDEIGKTVRFKGAYCSTVDEEVLNETLGWMIREFRE